MTGPEVVGLVIAVAVVIVVAVHELEVAHARRARRRSWRRHVARALEVSGRQVEQPRVFARPRRMATVSPIRSKRSAS